MYVHYIQSYVTGLRVKNETVTNIRNMPTLKETLMSFMIINILMQFYNFQIECKPHGFDFCAEVRTEEKGV